MGNHYHLCLRACPRGIWGASCGISMVCIPNGFIERISLTGRCFVAR